MTWPELIGAVVFCFAFARVLVVCLQILFVAWRADHPTSTRTEPKPIPCDCGKPSRSFCAMNPDLRLTLPRCAAPVCSDDGSWCKSHRHRPGTMGYYHPDSEIRYEVRRFVGESVWDKMRAAWRNLTWDEQRCARWAYKRYCDALAPPAPLPQNFLVIFDNGHKYRFRSGETVREA